MATKDVDNQVQDLLLLQRVVQKIATILDLDVLLEEIVGDVAETFGYSRSAVLLIDEATNEVVIAAVRGWTVNYHRKGERFPIGIYGIVGHVAATGETYYAPNVDEDPYYEVSEQLTRSELDIPLRARGRLIGVFDVQHNEVDAFGPARIQLLEALAGHVATAVDNARLFSHERAEKQRMIKELAEAQAIQQDLLPSRTLEIPGFAISGICVPCRTVAGDWFDYIPLPDGRVAIVVADVAGKGMAAALLMSSTRSLVRILSERETSPAAVLHALNDILLKDFPQAKFVTMVYALADPARRTVTFANAGHPAPLLVVDGKQRFVEASHGIPLGIQPATYSEQTVAMAAGARLVMYSDGVIETSNADDDEFGYDRLAAHFARHDSSAENLIDDLHQFTKGTPLADDATVVIIDSTAEYAAEK